MVRIYRLSVNRREYKSRGANFAMLHDVELPEPNLIEWIACGVDNVTEVILFSKYKHGFQEAFHRIC